MLKRYTALQIHENEWLGNEFIKADIGQEMYNALEDAVRGLEWHIDECPEQFDEADYEKLEEWKQILIRASQARAEGAE